MLSNYPPGAENDPRAPWNQVDPEPRTIEVTVSISLSKTMKIDVDDYTVECDEEDGNTYYDYSECNLIDAVREQVTLPDKAYDKLYWAVYSVDNSNAHNALEDLKDWTVDDIEVVSEE